MPVPAAVMLAIKYGPAAYGVLKSLLGDHSHAVDWGEVDRWLASQSAEGSLSQQDNAAADATKSRLMQGAEDTARGQMYATQSRLRQRGVDVAPAAETSLSRVAASLARARQAAGDAAEEQRYNIWLGNKQYKQQRINTMLAARIGAARETANYGRAGDAELVNSTMGYVSDLARGAPGGGGSSMSTSLDPEDYGGTAGVDVAPRSSTEPMSTRIARKRYNPATGTFGSRPVGRSAYQSSYALG